MTRPHTEFLHAQQLPWEPFEPAAAAGGPAAADRAWRGVEVKVLSRDASTGACSVLLRYPRGWSRGAHALAASHEMWVLEGALELGSVRYALDDYAWLPPGHRLAGAASPTGAVVLAFFDREPTDAPPADPAAADGGPAGGASAPGLIERLATHELPWTSADIDPSVQFLRLAHKVLRHVPATGEKTLLLSVGAQTHPRDWREAQLSHDCVEEMYQLGGDIIGERGTMYEGAYFWRPPGKWHGPFGSRRGGLSLIRFCEGHHRNAWGTQALPFTLEPGHAPVLPAALAARAGSAWTPPRF